MSATGLTFTLPLLGIIVGLVVLLYDTTHRS